MMKQVELNNGSGFTFFSIKILRKIFLTKISFIIIIFKKRNKSIDKTWNSFNKNEIKKKIYFKNLKFSKIRHLFQRKTNFTKRQLQCNRYTNEWKKLWTHGWLRLSVLAGTNEFLIETEIRPKLTEKLFQFSSDFRLEWKFILSSQKW